MRKKLIQTSEEELEEPLINLTPLIDVVFVILITFILIAPVIDIDNVDLAASGATVEKKEINSSPISISVHADNTIWYQGKKTTITDLKSILIQEKKRHPKATPQIAHDKLASFGTYQTLKNTLEELGFEKMDVVLKPS
jgi:biopolymer transport protein ExbD